MPMVRSMTNAYFANTAHIPDLSVAPARGTRLVPKSCSSGVLPVAARSRASYSASWSIPSMKIHDMLKPTIHLLPVSCANRTQRPTVETA